jgi:hypothetical protein
MGARLMELDKEKENSNAEELNSSREAVLQDMANNAIIILKGSHPAVVSGEIPKPITPRRFLKQIGVESADVKYAESNKRVVLEVLGNLREPVFVLRKQKEMLKHCATREQLKEKVRISDTDSDLPELSQVEEDEDDVLLCTLSQSHCGTPEKLMQSKCRPSDNVDCVTPSTAEAARNLLALTG